MFLGVIVADVQRQNCECFFFGPLGGCRRQEARDSTPCKTQLVWQDAPDIVKVDGFDLEPGKKVSLLKGTAHPP